MAGGGSTFIRVCYLIIPLALTILTTILLLVSFLNQTNSSLRSFYYLRISTAHLSLNTVISGLSKDLPPSVVSALPPSLTAAAAADTSALPSGVPGIAAFYDIGLWNYCSGPNINAGPNFCSKTSGGGYAFDPLAVWGLEANDVKTVIPDSWTDDMNTYKTVAHWLFVSYIVALVASFVTIILGLLSFCLHRLSSVLTSLSAAVTCLFISATATTATALYVTVGGFVDGKLGAYGIRASLGGRLLAVTWLAVAGSMVAALLWTCGCCCAGNRRERTDGTGRKKGTWGAARERDAYQRLGDDGAKEALFQQPAGHHQDHYHGGVGGQYDGQGYGGEQVPMQAWRGSTQKSPAPGAYEPYRGGDLGA